MKCLWGIALVLASCGSNMRGGAKPDGGGGGGDMGFVGCQTVIK
jgi:hypothetical protein